MLTDAVTKSLPPIVVAEVLLHDQVHYSGNQRNRLVYSVFRLCIGKIGALSMFQMLYFAKYARYF